MIDYAVLARSLQEGLDLEIPPIGIRFLSEQPADAPSFAGSVPSACALWREAESGSFFAGTGVHENCVVGMHTMGLSMTSSKQDELMDVIALMHSAGYLDENEVAHIPTVPGEKGGIVYGPLSQWSGECDAALLWVTAAQAMILHEAAGTVAWSENSGIPTFGRPSCAAIPLAMQTGRPAQSVGCAGMRLFTGISDDRMLEVLPSQALEGLSTALDKAVKANRMMRERYGAQLAAFAKPS